MTSNTTTHMTLRQRLRSCVAPLHRLAVEKAGSTFMFLAFALPMILGMAALGLDVTMWYLDRRENQTLADNIALAATIELNNDSNVSDTTLESLANIEAKRVGFDENGTERSIEVNRPPLSGPNAGNNQFVEVVVSEQRELYLAGLALNGPVTVQGRAVGSIAASGNHCVVALDPDMDNAIHVTGTADVNLSCGMASNSASTQSIYIDGKAALTADPTQAYGDILVTSNANLTTDTPPQPLSARLADPYLSTAMSVMPSLNNSCKSDTAPFDIKTDAKSGSGTVGNPYVLSPNWNPATSSGNVKMYCGGIVANGKMHIQFEPGIYVVDDGDVSFSAQSTVTVAPGAPNGVTFILTAYEPGNKISYTGNFRIAGGADVDLMAPTEGPTAGLLIIQDPRAPSSYGDGTTCEPDTTLQCNSLEGGSDMSLTGVIYAPTREVRFAGNTGAGGSQCTQIIARKVTFAGTADIANDSAACAAAGVQSVAQNKIRLVE